MDTLISHEACIQAGELLAEREEIADSAQKVLAADEVCISYRRRMKKGEETGKRSTDFVETEPMDMTADVRELLVRSYRLQLAGIDKTLRALGVSPPPLPEGL